MTELLSPAGSMDALKAAIANGADAVYLGGKSFSARAFADNFTLDEIAEAVRLAHFHNVRVYVAVNTLTADEEMPGLLLYVAELYRRGVDAIILQDIGAIELLGRILPALPRHASTQMTVHSAAACRLLADSGVERVILARELSLDNLHRLAEESPLPLETFVHGALCICYSGQCLFSSMVGGRSGNRGRCAQPCRMAYKLTDSFGDEIENSAEGRYLLSPRDLFGYAHLEELYQTGMAAWKIEGRMKKPQYVATVTRVYAEALELLEAKRPFYPDDEALRQLMQVFNRDRCSAYWFGNPGSAAMSYNRPNNRGMFVGRITEAGNGWITIKLVQQLHRGDGVEIWQTGRREGCTVEELRLRDQVVSQAAAGESVQIQSLAGRPGDRVFKTYDSPLMEQAERSYATLPDKAIHFTVSARIGAPIRLTAIDGDGYTASRVSEYIVEPANKASQSLQVATNQLGRLGGSGYFLASLKGELDDNALLPPSILNQLRREVVDDIFAQRQAKDVGRPFDMGAFTMAVKQAEPKPAPPRKAKQMEYSILVNTAEGINLAGQSKLGEIYFDTVGFAEHERYDLLSVSRQWRDKGLKVVPYLPQIVLPQEEAELLIMLRAWQNSNISAIVANNLGQIRLLRESGWQKRIYAGMGINCFNSAACGFLAKQGVSRVILSPELTLNQLAALDAAGLETQVFGQGAAQLMVSEYCLLGAVCGHRHKDEKEDSPCLGPCRRLRDVNLTDEKGYAFPVRADHACRSHIFNSRQHCLLLDMPDLAAAGVDSLLLDMRLYPRKEAESILNLYRLAQGDQFSYEEAKRRLPTVIKDYTKGHLYRGV